jgi:uncharacterized iron-regulated membrane protein
MLWFLLGIAVWILLLLTCWVWCDRLLDTSSPPPRSTRVRNGVPRRPVSSAKGPRRNTTTTQKLTTDPTR